MPGRREAMQFAGLALLAASGPVGAVTRLAPPEGEVLLTVRGGISVTNQGDAARLDRDQLLGWGVDELRTTTPFTDGVSTFTGVLGSRLLDGLGARGSGLRASALNDYTIEIPIAELRQYPVLLALDRDGQPLSVRHRGPIWLVYPWSDFPELDDRVHRQRSIWQLVELEVR
jgi:hypothetical protein